MKRFRPNVAAVLQRSDGKILVAERLSLAGAWQFPQGGVNFGEASAQALARELEEEIGVLPEQFEVAEIRPGYRYLFPKGIRKKGSWVGQEQTYFLCRYLGEGKEEEFRLDGAHPEFSRVKWIEPGDFDLAWLPAFKRDVYCRVFADLFGVQLR